MIDDFDGQFADDVSKLSKLKKKVVSSCTAVDAGINRMSDNLRACCRKFLLFAHRVVIDRVRTVHEKTDRTQYPIL